ncbi:MAG: hypothetical protein AB7J32_08535 [Pseudonocardia sp.]
MASRTRKPRELLRLQIEADRLFEVLRRRFGVPETYVLGLERVDVDARRPQDLAAYTMWQAQHLHRLATAGVVTTSEAVIMTCAQLAHHLELLTAETADTADQDAMLRTREDLFLAARAVAALDGGLDGPPLELY